MLKRTMCRGCAIHILIQRANILCVGSDNDQVHKSYVQIKLMCKPAHDFVTPIPTNMYNRYQASFSNTAKVAPYKVMFLITQNF